MAGGARSIEWTSSCNGRHFGSS